MNASRIIGPLVAGALIASFGSPAFVFVLNAILSIGAGFVIMRWRREHKESPLGRERLASAMRVGVQYVWQSSRMRAVLLRISLFFLHSTALLALLPLVARALPGGRRAPSPLLLASMGAGAIVAALTCRGSASGCRLQTLVLAGTATQAARDRWWRVSRRHIYVAVPAMFFSGMAWITVANSLTVAAQMALPDWVRARGMSIYQMALMGSTAAGAALLGPGRRPRRSIHDSLASRPAPACADGASPAARGGPRHRGRPDALARVQGAAGRSAARAGRIQTNIEYRIDPARAAEFMALMQESRRSRMRQGALDWQLLHDLYDPGRFVEQITDESWTEHLRRFDRVTAGDVQLRDRKLAFHIAEEPPLVTRFLVER